MSNDCSPLILCKMLFKLWKWGIVDVRNKKEYVVEYLAKKTA